MVSTFNHLQGFLPPPKSNGFPTMTNERILFMKKKRQWNKIIGTILMIAGIGVIAYPFYSQWNSGKEKDKLLDAIYAQIDINKKQNNSEAKNLEKNLEIKEENLESIDLEEEYNQLELEMNQTQNVNSKETESEKEKTIQEVLSYQTLVGIIECEKINIKFPIVEGTERINIAVSVGHMKGTAGLGEDGNCVLAAHRGGIYGTFFKHIDQIEAGDIVKVTNMNGEIFEYEMYESFIVEPSEMWIIENIEKERTLTLVSCENDGKQRLIVRCRKKES